MFFLNIEGLQLILQSRLFHSYIVEGNNSLVGIAGTLLLYLISRMLFKLGIKSNGYSGEFCLNIS